MRAFSIQLQISPLSRAISKPNQAKLIMYNVGENNFNELPMQNKWKLTYHLLVVIINEAKHISLLVMWWEITYDVIYLFDVVAALASTIVYDRGVQPAARGPSAIQQSGFLCRSLVPDSLCETKARPVV